MAGKPAAPSSSSRPENGGRGAPEDGALARERVGPLTIERLRKDDDRALILYSSEERSGQ